MNILYQYAEKYCCRDIITSIFLKGSVCIMAKAGMRRPDPKQPHGTESNKKANFPQNDVAPVPEVQGKAKSGKASAKQQKKN